MTPVRVRALADTGALMLCVPEHVAVQLRLDPESVREVSVADGRRMSVPYVGPVKVTFGKRFCYVGALVLGDEVLLGSVPMEDMDLVVNPGRRKVTVDPANPNAPHDVYSARRVACLSAGRFAFTLRGLYLVATRSRSAIGAIPSSAGTARR